jgi:O-succinylbenzoate synthase
MSEQNPGRKPPLAVYAIIERKEGQKSLWIKVGAAFVNRDGSTSLLLDAFPIGTNRLQVREAREWEKAAGGANGQEARP